MPGGPLGLQIADLDARRIAITEISSSLPNYENGNGAMQFIIPLA